MNDQPSPNKGALAQTLIAIFVLAAGTFGYIYLAPYILPVSIAEGPLVQRPTPTGATLVWFTSKPAECTLTLETETGPRELPVEMQAENRCVAVATDLAPDTPYGYVIRAGQRTLGEYVLRTAKTAPQPFSFVVFGDSGKASQPQYVLAELMHKLEPDFLLHTGDLVYSDGARGEYPRKFFGPYRKMISSVAFWPCLGNHDVDDAGAARPYVSVFELPDNGPPDAINEHHYWFDYASARIAVIDSNVSEQEMADKLAPWLREVMSAPGPTWRFVSLHHPPYTGGKYKPELSVQKTLVPVFEETGVDVVFAGHDHMYQRLRPLRGGEIVDEWPFVQYIVTGAGGARLYDPREANLPAYVDQLYNERHSFTHVEIAGDKLRARQINDRGETLDEWGFAKVRAAPEPAAD